MTEPLISVRDLHVSFQTQDGSVKAVDGVSFDVMPGETLGVVGESGSGKSVTANAIMRLNFGTQVDVSGEIIMGGRDLLKISDEEMRMMRGQEIAMVFQDPLTALNPFYTVGSQIAEAHRIHNPKATKKELREVVLNAMVKVGIPEPVKRMDSFPHEFSGGMRQRIVIAIALVNNPKLLIADEPTTALDVTVQAQILDLIGALQDEFGSAVMLITHDLGVIAETADRVMVLYAGHAVEVTDVDHLFNEPTHPYTLGLLGSVHSLDGSTRGALRTITGTPPSLINLPPGCAFHPRCRFELGEGSACRTASPALRDVGSSLTACHLADSELLQLVSKDGV